MAKDLAKQIASRMITHALRTTTSAVKKVGRGTAVKHPKEPKHSFNAENVNPIYRLHPEKPVTHGASTAQEHQALAEKIKQQFGNVHSTVGSSQRSVITRQTKPLRGSRRNPENYAPEHEEEGPIDPWKHPAAALSRIPLKKPRKETYSGGMTRKQRVTEQKVHAKEHFDKPLASRAAAVAAERHHQNIGSRIGGMTSRTITMPEAKRGFQKFIEARKKLGGKPPATTTQAPSVQLHLGPAMERQSNRFKKKSFGGILEFMKSKGKPWKSEKGKKKIHKVMHEYKHGELKSGSKHGPKVASRKQAVAIALSEAREANKSFMGIVEFIKSKKSMKPGGGGRFAKLTAKLRSEGKSAGAAKAIAAKAGRAKYGKKKMAKFAAKGRKRAMKKSWSSIIEFMKGRRKKTLKAGRVRGARLSSGTYRQVAPSVKRSVRAKLHSITTAKRKNKGLAPVEKSKKRKRHRIDDYRAETKYDRELTRYEDGDQEHPFDENEGITHSPTEPERARGKYEKRRYNLQREA